MSYCGTMWGILTGETEKKTMKNIKHQNSQVVWTQDFFNMRKGQCQLLTFNDAVIH